MYLYRVRVFYSRREARIDFMRLFATVQWLMKFRTLKDLAGFWYFTPVISYDWATQPAGYRADERARSSRLQGCTLSPHPLPFPCIQLARMLQRQNRLKAVRSCSTGAARCGEQAGLGPWPDRVSVGGDTYIRVNRMSSLNPAALPFVPRQHLSSVAPRPSVPAQHSHAASASCDAHLLTELPEEVATHLAIVENLLPVPLCTFIDTATSQLTWLVLLTGLWTR